jgi:hypothetical protein
MQEKMLVEAVQITELENAKWIHTRQYMAEEDKSIIMGSKLGVAGTNQQGAHGASDTTSYGRHKYYWKTALKNRTLQHHFLSRIGQYTTFLEGSDGSAKEKKVSTHKKAYITQQPAKCCDPKTNIMPLESRSSDDDAGAFGSSTLIDNRISIWWVACKPPSIWTKTSAITMISLHAGLLSMLTRLLSHTTIIMYNASSEEHEDTSSFPFWQETFR